MDDLFETQQKILDFLFLSGFAELDPLASDGGVTEAQSSSSTEAADNIV